MDYGLHLVAMKCSVMPGTNVGIFQKVVERQYISLYVKLAMNLIFMAWFSFVQNLLGVDIHRINPLSS